jgi:tetratricopeptide (TPR) repeat protein
MSQIRNQPKPSSMQAGPGNANGASCATVVEPGVAIAEELRGHYSPELERRIKQYFHALDDVRRGVCLLNAGAFQEAAIAFSQAAVHGGTMKSLASYLAACHLGQGNPEEAARSFGRQAADEPDNPGPRIRQAHALAESGQRPEAIALLRQAIANHPETAELHFQLGLMLSEEEDYEEAELRFTQAVNLDADHTDALLALAMCMGVRQAPDQAVRYLVRAQARRPFDPTIAFMLSKAAAGLKDEGEAVSVRATIPDETVIDDRAGIDELARVIAADPDFVDAFISIPRGAVDEQVFAVLLRTIEVALERQPEQAELHFHCGQLLERLDRPREAIDATERAVGLSPRFTRALINLGKLYHRTDRAEDAVTRFEQAVAVGGDYADVYYLLGKLYRDRGEIHRARLAFRRALSLNERYEEARQALQSLEA